MVFCPKMGRISTVRRVSYIDNIRYLIYHAIVIIVVLIEKKPMPTSLNVTLTGELRHYVDSRASDSDVYATPSEYIRDLIRRDMEDWRIVSGVVQGLREVGQGDFATESILDILNE